MSRVVEDTDQELALASIYSVSWIILLKLVYCLKKHRKLVE